MKSLVHISKAAKVGLATALLVVIGIAGANPNQNSPKTQPAAVLGNQSQSSSPAKQEPAEPIKTTKELTTTVAVPYESETVQSPSLEKGTTKITTQGVDGVKTQVWTVTYLDGTETSRELKSESLTTPPVTEVTTIGTKAAALYCPNGTYINSASNTVCRPYESTSAPAGATALCRDGTYSFSQSRSGTCSHHGGVARWL